MRIRFIAAMAAFLLVVITLPAAAQETKASSRYAGSFIVETTDNEQYYWYVHPELGERYAINTSVDFSRLLKNVGVGIQHSEVQSIRQVDSDTGSLAIAEQHIGKILIDVGDSGRAWYVDPLSRERYYLANGKDGFEVAKQLALDVRGSILSEIPVVDRLGFNEIRYIQKEPILDFATYDSVFDILRNGHLYKDSFTDEDLYYSSLKGMVIGTGDPNSEFLTPAENQEQLNTFFGDLSIEGIGAVIQARDNGIYVLDPVDGGPAEAAGLLSLDQIISVNGISLEGKTVDEAVSIIKGPAGSTALLTVYRPGTGVTFQVEIIRARIEVPLVESKLYENGTIPYYRFTLFSQGLVQDFLDEMNKTVTSQTKGIIIDLRDNIGGVTQSAAQLADMWLENGETVYIQRSADLETQYLANPDRFAPHVPVVILVNEGTASAAEIFTLALRQNNQATVVGTQTYGKGTGQNIVSFSDGSGLKYTTFEWLPSDEVSIDGVGITPDVILELNRTSDNQLRRAIDILNY